MVIFTSTMKLGGRLGHVPRNPLNGDVDLELKTNPRIFPFFNVEFATFSPVE